MEAHMKVHNVKTVRERFATLYSRANESLGEFGSSMLGIGRYLPGKSPWERHKNGDELLYVTDGRVTVEVLEGDGSSHTFHVGDGELFVVPTGKWHQLTLTEHANILFASPSEDGAERTREHPLGRS